MKKICLIALPVLTLLFFIFSTPKINVWRIKNAAGFLAVDKTDSSLQLINGIYYYQHQLFSGTIRELYENGMVHHTTACSNGKEEGWSMMYYPDGKLAEKRYYHLGEKDSIHMGCWQNGKQRFEYHFRMGMYNGDYKEWYSSGNAYKYIHYINGADDWGKGWRENGKLFMNYTMYNGRRYGIVNSNLCYTIKNEKGEFTAAAK